MSSVTYIFYTYHLFKCCNVFQYYNECSYTEIEHFLKIKIIQAQIHYIHDILSSISNAVGLSP
jgi:hypothetical protein